MCVRVDDGMLGVRGNGDAVCEGQCWARQVMVCVRRWHVLSVVTDELV